MKFYLSLVPFAAATATATAIQSDVIIIGAGPAGMSAAKILHERDPTATITILEATDRIGGRVKTMQLGDSRVEMGAEDHYGADGGNPVHQALTAAYPEIYVDAYQGSEVYAMPPGRLGEAEPDAASSESEGTCGTVTYGGDTGLTKNCADDQEWEKYLGIFSWYYDSSQFQNDPTQTCEDALSRSRKFFGGIDDYKESRGWFLYDNQFAGEYGTTVDKMGAYGVAIAASDWSLSDTIYLNTNNLGYSDVLNNTWWDETINTATVTLRLSSPVTDINAPVATGPVEVIANGEPYYANQVIVAIPIGVLKASIDPKVQPGDPGCISFSPELPDITKQAITDIGFDQGLKVALKFDRNLPTCGNSEPWWETAVGGEVSFMITNGLSGGTVWPANYKDGSTDDVFMTFIVGDNAKEISNLSDEDMISRILSDMDAMYDGTPASDCFTLDPDNYVIQNWGESPYTRGAYSYQTPTTFDNDGDADATGNARARLQVPVYNNRLFFAGEGTSLVAGATVPGAIFEGERAGNAVIISGGSLQCGNIDSSQDCHTNNNCRWNFGECVSKRARTSLFGRRNDMDSTQKETPQLIQESKSNIRTRHGARRKMDRGGKTSGIDSRGKDMYHAAKGAKGRGSSKEKELLRVSVY